MNAYPELPTMKTLIAGLAIGAVLIVVVIVALSHVAGFNVLSALLADPKHDGERIEREAQAAGEKAAEEKTRELDKETDAEVAADSAVADEHAADLEQRHEFGDLEERTALDDLHRRLHEHLQSGAGEGAEDVQRERVTESDVDDLLGDLRRRLLGGAPQPAS